MNFLRTAKETLLAIASCVLLACSWWAIALSVKAGLSATTVYHGALSQILLDARFGYLGLLSVGFSSCALITVKAFNSKISRSRFVRIFQATFLVGIFFLLPTIFATVVFLVKN
jgi:hypothetical protein